MNPGIRILPLPSGNGLLEGELADSSKGNFLFLEWETILKADEPQVGKRHEDETQTLTGYYFLWKDLKLYIKKEETKWINNKHLFIIALSFH